MQNQTINQLFKTVSQQLSAQSIDTAQLDTELLLAHSLDYSRAKLRANLSNIITDQQLAIFEKLVARRIAGEPIAYILEQQEFWSLPLKVTAATLIPRPETEQLVELTLQLLPNTEKLTVADLGTGSGAIALALAKERPHWQVIATDQSTAALAIALENAQRLAITNVQFYQGDWCAALPTALKCAAIVGNPPYLAPHDPHLHNLSYEPERALVAEANGLAALRTIAQQAKKYLKSNGYLLLEHGYDQGEAVAEILQMSGYSDIQTHLDLAGLPRLASGIYSG